MEGLNLAGVARLVDAGTWPPPGENGHAEDGAELLDDVAAHIRRYVVMSDSAKHTITAWLVHVHAIEAFYTTPRLNITSPEAECGKTMLLVDVMAPLLVEPIVGVSITPAPLYRELLKRTPAILIDELDNTLGRKGAGDSETLSLLLAILNSGYRRGQYTYRCVGKNHDTQAFPTFAPAAFAGIASNLSYPFVSRSIEIPLQRKRDDETATELEWSAATAAMFTRLNARIAAWAQAHLEVIREARPARPDGMTGRRAEIWSPLLQVAHVAGEEWAKRIRESFKELAIGSRSEDASTGHRLLVALHEVFGDAEAMHTTEILDALNHIEESPWGTWNDDQGIKAHELAKHTERYRTHKKTVQVWHAGTNRWGYKREWFQDAWARCLNPLVPPPDEKGTRALEPYSDNGSGHYAPESAETPELLQGNGSSGLVPQTLTGGTRGIVDDDADAGRPVAVLDDHGRPTCSACGGQLQHFDQHRCPWVACRAWLRADDRLDHGYKLVEAVEAGVTARERTLDDLGAWCSDAEQIA